LARVVAAPTEGDSDFVCPRCGAPVTARFYGPCPSCRDQLTTTMRRDAEVVERPAFEPAINVVPNQVATKE
jgi:predicted amidophosphoribosyltransferase